MFGLLKRKKPYNWKTEHGRLWASLVPADGQAATLQGELIRIAGKLTDQAFRNGNMNWDAEHERMWRFVATSIADWDGFSARDRRLIRDKIEEIIRTNDCPNLNSDESPYYIVGEKVVDWCMGHPEPIAHSKDATLKR